MSSRKWVLAKCKFSGYQSQEGGAKRDARNCDMVAMECPCVVSPKSPLFQTPPRHIRL